MNRLSDVFEQFGAGQQGYARLSRNRTRGVLETELQHMLRSGTDEGHAASVACLRKSGILAQESVAGVNRFRSGLLRRSENCRNRKVALGGRRRPDRNGFVGLL